jgi:hypothetical protein
MLRHLFMWNVVVLAEEPSHTFCRRVVVADRVDLRAVARRQNDHLAARAARRQRRQGLFDAVAREIDRLAELDRGGAVAQTDGVQSHF